jgi:hypothetical protein
MTTLTYEAGARHEAKDETKKADKVTKNRVQLDFAPRSMERLNALKAKTEAASYAEVVKNALRLYEGLIEEVESGKTFLIRDENGAISPFKMFL